MRFETRWLGEKAPGRRKYIEVKPDAGGKKKELHTIQYTTTTNDRPAKSISFIPAFFG